ncbi:response regulator [Chryseolinea sp. Jin1]|uniref:Response regulator n=2 Tax=Chryseolinea lacunae TaxID=2801331 RepID=A0ABS1KMQ5_9BACT|nr:response regulator [Chryseolinea lacunae]
MALEEVDREIECIMANNGISALNTLRSDNAPTPDYIFIDLNMPKMNGLECLQEIQKLSHLKDARVFMYSTSVDDYVLQKSKALGAMEFIVKPTGITPLIEKLSEVFTQNR